MYYFLDEVFAIFTRCACDRMITVVDIFVPNLLYRK